MRPLILAVIALCVSLWAVPTAFAQTQLLWTTSMTESEEGDAAFARLKEFFLQQGDSVANKDWVSVKALVASALGEKTLRELAQSVSVPVQETFMAEATRTFVRKNGLQPTNGSVRWSEFRRIGVNRGKGGGVSGYLGFTQADVDEALRIARAAHPEPAPVKDDAEDTIVTVDGGMVPGATAPVSETGEERKVGQPVNLRPDPELFPQVSTEIPTTKVPEASAKTPTARPTESDCSAVKVSPELAAIGVVATCALDASARAETSAAEAQALSPQIAELQRGQEELRTELGKRPTKQDLDGYQTTADAKAQQERNDETYATKRELAESEKRMQSSLKNFTIGIDNFSFGARIAMTIAGVVVILVALWILWFLLKPPVLWVWRRLKSAGRSVAKWRREQSLKAKSKRQKSEGAHAALEGEIVLDKDARRSA